MRESPLPSLRQVRKLIWIPFGFAAFLALIRLFVPAADPVFYSFLPMCFFFAASAQQAVLAHVEALAARGTGERGREDPRAPQDRA